MQNSLKHKMIVITKVIAFYLIAVYIAEAGLLRKIVWPSIFWMMERYPEYVQAIASFTGLDYGRIVGRIFSFIGVVIVYCLFVKFVDKSSLRNSVLFPKSGAFKYFIKGCLLGALMVLITIGITLITQSVTLQPLDDFLATLPNVILLYLFLQFLTAMTEELILRGYVLNNLAEVINPNIAVILTSLIFGYMHLQYSLLYAVMAFVFGLIAGYGFLITRNLYFCIGLHFAWNCIESVLYSKSLFCVTVYNSLLAGNKYISPDQQGYFALPALVLGLALVLKMKEKK